MLSDELKRLRKERNLTQNQLADALNVSQSTVASWEKGTRMPTTDFIPTIADFYGISLDRLLGMIDDTQPPTPQMPRTQEARILSAGVDRMPEADRKRILKMVELMFEQYRDFFEGNDDN